MQAPKITSCPHCLSNTIEIRHDPINSHRSYYCRACDARLSDFLCCKKCKATAWGSYISGGSIGYYCKSCRSLRARKYQDRKANNGGSHSQKEWRDLLAKSPICPWCRRAWADIPPRPNSRFKTVVTKDHIVPVSLGGTDSIENIQPLCYQCNFSKNNSPTPRKKRSIDGPRFNDRLALGHMIIKLLQSYPSGLSIKDIYRIAESAINMNDTEKELVRPNGDLVWKHNLRFARDRLGQQGQIVGKGDPLYKRGWWRLCPNHL